MTGRRLAGLAFFALLFPALAGGLLLWHLAAERRRADRRRIARLGVRERGE